MSEVSAVVAFFVQVGPLVPRIVRERAIRPPVVETGPVERIVGALRTDREGHWRTWPATSALCGWTPGCRPPTTDRHHCPDSLHHSKRPSAL
jgi:hypothetical protein